MNSALIEIVSLLAAAVVIVPLAQRLGLGSVLGYLLAGVVIGPYGLRLVENPRDFEEVSELGVVFLLFLIGLELDPRRLWSLRIPIFGMGSAQILIVTALGAGLGRVFGLEWPAAIVLGLGVSMSSTAIATQVLKERSLFSTPGGSSAFSILLFQDIAVIPILALLPLLAGREGAEHAEPAWKILAVIAGVIVAGNLVLRHVFRLVASANLREVFTALSLLVVFGLASLMHQMGVSMALGAFMGGVLLATSEYRHAVEIDIEPFKGLLLGLFFMNVGNSVNFALISSHLGSIFGLLVAVIVIKALSHALLAYLFRLRRNEIPLFSLIIAQVGEFAFVLFGAAQALDLLKPEEVGLFSAVVALSLGVTPLMLKAFDRWVAPHMEIKSAASEEAIENINPEVIIAGFGRVGQIVGRLLFANRIRATVLDQDPEQIESLRRFGFKVYYGNATRLDLLEAAGASTAKLIVIAVDDVEASLEIAKVVRENFPQLKIVARARNLAHVYKLLDLGVQIWERETFDSSLRMGTEVLRELGWSPYRAIRAGHKFRRHNLSLLFSLHGRRDDQREVISATKQARADLEKMFLGENESIRRSEEGWDIHPEGR